MSAVSEPVQLPMPPPAQIEEWDDPAMAEFKRQEAEDREAFGCSDEAREWWDKVRKSPALGYEIKLAPKFHDSRGFKLVRLPW